MTSATPAIIVVVLLGLSSRAIAAAPATQPARVTVNPNDILFTTPTLNDALPDAGAARAGPNSVHMHEDDWRQFEFVDSRFSKEIAAELADVDRIWKEQSVSLGDGTTGFRNVHVRKGIPQPLNIPMTPAEFATLFGGKLTSIVLLGADTSLADVHAVQLDGVVIYAMIRDNRLTTLGIETDQTFSLPPDVADRLERFITDHKLELIHWRSRTRFENTAAIMKYLRGKPPASAAASQPAPR